MELNLEATQLYQLAFIDVTLKLGEQSNESTLNQHLTRFNTKSENYVLDCELVLESPRAIHKLTILALLVAVRTLQMVGGRDNCQLPASVAFDAQQQQCLSQISPLLQGSTRK